MNMFHHFFFKLQLQHFGTFKNVVLSQSQVHRSVGVVDGGKKGSTLQVGGEEAERDAGRGIIAPLHVERFRGLAG